MGVVLLVPGPLAHEVQGLRRACGDPALERVPPHLTLVPPVNVSGSPSLRETTRRVRRAAGAVGPFRLTIGPARSFAPDSPTLYLEVGGDASEVEALHLLRDEVFRPPLHRELTWPFVPHVTLADGVDEQRLVAGVSALADYRAEMPCRSLHLLCEQRTDDGPRWVPLADYRLGGPSVVGRGSLPLELWTSERPDPEAVMLLAGEHQGWPEHGDRLTVTARRDEELVGVLWGTNDGEVRSAAVAPQHRGQGIARHLRARFEYEVDQLRRQT